VSVKKIGVLAAGAVVAGGLALGGAAMASAATATPGPGSSADAPGRHGGRHTPVTGDEAAKVSAAVTAKDAAVTVSRVVKTGDGAYHVFGVKDGDRVHFTVSADLGTVTEGKAGPGRGHGHPGEGTAATADEAAKVTAAVTAKDAAVTVSRVVKTGDGSYHVFGAKDDKRVHLRVSADLKTVTEGRAGRGGPGVKRGGGERPVPAPSSSS
jgi:hypothetical protein